MAGQQAHQIELSQLQAGVVGQPIALGLRDLIRGAEWSGKRHHPHVTPHSLCMRIRKRRLTTIPLIVIQVTEILNEPISQKNPIVRNRGLPLHPVW